MNKEIILTMESRLTEQESRAFAVKENTGEKIQFIALKDQVDAFYRDIKKECILNDAFYDDDYNFDDDSDDDFDFDDFDNFEDDDDFDYDEDDFYYDEDDDFYYDEDDDWFDEDDSDDSDEEFL